MGRTPALATTTARICWLPASSTWPAFPHGRQSAVLTALLVVALVLAAVGFAWDVGAPLPLAVGAGAVLGLIVQPVHVGLPPYVATSGDAGGLLGLVAGLAPDRGGVPFEWVHKPHWALALCIVLLVAAALEAGIGRRQAVLIAAAAGVMALAEAAVLVFASMCRAGRGGRQSSFPARRPPATSSGKRARHCRPAGRAWRRARVRYALSARRHDGHGSDRI